MLRSISCLVLGGFLATTLSAQSFYSGIRGAILDQKGSAIPNARVSLTDELNGVVRLTTTGADGSYVFNQVIPSTYSVSAEISGFKKSQQKNIVIATQEQKILDFALEIGDTSQTINVTGEAPLIETAAASQGQVLTDQQLTELPNIGRNPFITSKLAQNVIQVGNPVMNRMQDQSSTGLISIAGGLVWQNNFFMDGIPIGDWQGRPIVIPSIEAVSEVKIQANTYDAEMGRTGGGVFNTILKSGTNNLHGTAYGAIRRTDMNANLFFNNAAELPRGNSPNDNWAANLGGPIFVPKVYNGKNRAFFFLALEGYNNTEAASLRSYVPTALERIGDFSQTRTPSGAQQVIFDPSTTVRNPDGTYTRTPFPNNIIPSTNLVGRNLANYYPLPTSTAAYYGDLNKTASGAAASRGRQYVGKVDVQLFNWWRATLSYLRYNSVEPGANYFGGPASPDQWALARNVDTTAVNNLFTLTPTTVLAVRYGFNRFPNVFYTTSEIQGFDPATLGLPSSLVSQMMGRAFPTISPSTASGLANSNHSWNTFVNNSVSAMISQSRGKHSLKAGFDFRRLLVSGYGYGDMAGSFAFNGVFTQSSPTNPTSGTGADIADMLLGYPSSGSAGLAIKLTDSTRYYSFYVQDDFRVTNRLTLNLGLRWERETGIQEQENRLYVNFDKQAINPLAANVTGIEPKGVVQFAGSGANPTTVGSPNLNKLGPRIGVAFRIDDKTVIRGGYGLIWAPQSVIGSPLAPAGYAASTPYIATTDGFATSAGSLSNPFPSGLIQPLGKSQGSLTGIGQGVSIFSPAAKSPRIQQYSVDLQRELPGGIAIAVGYLGTRGTRLAMDVNQNVLDPAYFSRGSAVLNQSVPNPYYGNGGTGVIGTEKVGQYQLLLPFSAFGPVNFASTDLNNSRYDSLVVKGQKHLSRGFTFLSTLTIAKSYDRASAGNVLMSGPSGVQNPFDLGAERSLSSFNAPFVWANSFSYELPVGKGKAFMNGNQVLDYFLGGWQINGVGVYRSGFPLAIAQAQNFNGVFGYAGQRPNATGVSPVTDGSLNERLNNYINPAAFSQAPQFTFGNVSRLISMRGPGQANWDMSLFKTVTIREVFRAQFRAEALNAFNTPLFNGPNTAYNPASSSFGKITSQGNQARALQLCLRFFF